PDRADQERRLPRSGTRHQIQRKHAMVPEEAPVDRGQGVVLGQDVLFDLHYARGRNALRVARSARAGDDRRLLAVGTATTVNVAMPGAVAVAMPVRAGSIGRAPVLPRLRLLRRIGLRPGGGAVVVVVRMLLRGAVLPCLPAYRLALDERIAVAAAACGTHDNSPLLIARRSPGPRASVQASSICVTRIASPCDTASWKLPQRGQGSPRVARETVSPQGMHQAAPGVVTISSLARSARLPRVTASKQKRMASGSTYDSAPISSHTALTRASPFWRAVPSTISSTLSASAISCMAHLDPIPDAGIERLYREARALLESGLVGRGEPGEAVDERAVGMEIPFGRGDDLIVGDPSIGEPRAVQQQATRGLYRREPLARGE